VRIPASTRTSRCDVDVRAGRGRALLLLGGALDVAGVEKLDRIVEIVIGAGLPFVVDCEGLTFIDAAGINALVRAVSRGGILQGVHGPVRRVVELLGLTEQLGGPNILSQGSLGNGSPLSVRVETPPGPGLVSATSPQPPQDQGLSRKRPAA
jgi:anti-anti-sigma factor